MKRNPNIARGFTLLEVMIAVGILFLAIGMATSFLTESLKSAFISGEKSEINQDLRLVVDRLARDARQANFFLLYESATSEDRDGSSDRLYAGLSGDFLVLFEKTPYGDIITNGDIRDPRPIEKMTIYFRDVTRVEDGQEVGPVRIYRETFNPVISDPDVINNPESLYPDISALRAAPQVIELSEGLANGRLFYNLKDQTIMVNGKILHGNQAKRVTDTYNFSISPRG